MMPTPHHFTQHPHIHHLNQHFHQSDHSIAEVHHATDISIQVGHEGGAYDAGRHVSLVQSVRSLDVLLGKTLDVLIGLLTRA